MGGELTEANLNKIFDGMGDSFYPDTFLISSRQLKELKKMGAVRYDRAKCSWELLSEKFDPPKPVKPNKSNQ